MAKLATAGMAIGLFAVVLGLGLAPTVNETQTDTQRTAFVENGSNTLPTERVLVAVDNVNTTGNYSSTITLEDRETRESVTQTLNETETKSYELSGENISVTAASITSSGIVEVTTAIPSTYSWSDESKLLGEQLPSILILVGFVAVLGSIGAVIKSV